MRSIAIWGDKDITDAATQEGKCMSEKLSTRDKILEAMYQLVAKEGYDKASIGKISEAVGIAKPSVYYHFKSKEDIFNAVLDEMFVTVDYEKILRQAKNVEDFKNALIEVGNTVLDGYRDDSERRAVLGEMSIQATRIPSVNSHQIRLSDEAIESLEGGLSYGKEIGAFEPDFNERIVAETLQIIMSGLGTAVANHENIDCRAVWNDAVLRLFK